MKLLERGNIARLELKNRFVMSPMVSHLASEGEVTPHLIEYYARRAKGGVALIVLEAAFPRPGGQPGRLSICDDRFVRGLRSLVETVHREGARIAFQINPSRGRSDKVDAVSPSGVPHPTTGLKPRILTVEEIRQIGEDFAKGVQRAVGAGADAVMIHAGSGYLLSEFLSPRINKRTDGYGVDIAGRARFAVEVIELTKRVVPPGYPVMLRLTADERVEGGLSLVDAVTASRLFEQAGIDAIDIVSGVAESMEFVNPSMAVPRGYNAPVAAAIRKAVSIPVLVGGRICDPQQAEQILENGQADFVVLGRALIADPDFPLKVIQGRTDDICPCIACLRCTERNQLGQPLACSSNPRVGAEWDPERPASKAKRVLVVGGGPAGIQAALTAARRGHRVTLWEKASRLGGQMNLAAIPPHKEEMLSLLHFLERQVAKSTIELVLGEDATADSIIGFEADTIVLATGPEPIIPRIPGMEKHNVITNWEILSGKVPVGKRVVVIGGGLVGCETAEVLAETAQEVTIVEVLSELCCDSISQIRKPLLKRLSEKKVTNVTGVKSEQITQQGITVECSDGKSVEIMADQIVVAVGSRAKGDLDKQLRGRVPELYAIGDCRQPARIMEAAQQGREVGLKI